ncbi:hypothetical protein SAMN04488491_2492 [Psychrobacter sp. LV10R520-6]|nr:hypothetical protein SAMN04488491_2492 [Psychrobacter sp. LV10R520-6]
MRPIYAQSRVPLQIRRFMIFNKICGKAQKYPVPNLFVRPLSCYGIGIII